MSRDGAAPEFSERSVARVGTDVRYLEAGDGAPVVALHGAAGRRVMPAHALLAEQYRVILVEQPGFGGLDEVDDSPSMREYSERVHGMIGQIVTDSYTLIGTSFGSRVAGWIAASHPEEIDALILVSPTVFTPEGFGIATDAAPPVLYAHPERHSPPAVDPALRSHRLSLVSRLLTPADVDLETALGLLAVPTLVVFGTDDAVMPAQLGHRYIELNPDFFLNFVYDAGHLLEEERPEAAAALFSSFIEHPTDYHVGRESGLLFA